MMFSSPSSSIGNSMKHLAALLLALLTVPVLPAQQPDESGHLGNVLAQARVAQSNGDFVTAEHAYQQAVRIRPDIPEFGPISDSCNMRRGKAERHAELS